MLDKAVKFLEFVTICMVFRFIVMLFCMIVSHYRWLHSFWTYQDRYVLQGTQTLKTIINERMNIIYLIQKRIMPFSFLSLFWYNKVQSIVCLSCFEISHSSNYMPILAHGKNRIDRLNSSVRPSCSSADFLPEPAGQVLRLIVDVARDHSAPRRSRDACASSIPVPSFPNPRKKGITTLCSHKNA